MKIKKINTLIAIVVHCVLIKMTQTVQEKEQNELKKRIDILTSKRNRLIDEIVSLQANRWNTDNKEKTAQFLKEEIEYLKQQQQQI